MTGAGIIRRIAIPNVPEKSASRHQGLKKHKLFRKRAGMKPSTGHLKSDYRLARNFYKSVAGDAVNGTSGGSGLQLQKEP